MWNWFKGKEESNFVSEISRLSALFVIVCLRISNLFLKELIFKRAVKARLGFPVDPVGLFTVSVAFPLSVLLPTCDIHTFDWGNSFSIKLLSDNIVSKIALDVLFGAPLVPTCKMTLSGTFLTKV